MASLNLQRRVRARRDSSGDESVHDFEGSSSHSSDNAAYEDEESSLNDDAIPSDDDQSAHGAFETDLSSVSFGALARAQESLGKSKANTEKASTSSEKLQRLRETLHEIGERKARETHPKDSPSREKKSTESRTGRSNKHAPAEMSSKKAVSRKREVVAVQKREARDPRFEALSGPLDETRLKKNYSFLRDYQDSEMRSLRDEIKKTKDEAVKEKLKRALLSMESRRKAHESKEKQQEILREHRNKEKELVKQGKTPFYLKKGEQKKRALMERYNSLKGKQLDHVIERKRKKKASKERKNMPIARRAYSD
ncbi:DUF947-domain-containing protein [Xylona heveae TC161]|uniref:rRNA biogenesis protein RRP36 n=1 Tax=Xylona heveae (strain CBS 132557 / TC161) TaxID=1328760 RepID=A0A165GVN7_XYLHT|nr:DUF947-domain-containing protein [Xylona heveae TC161]KZF22654.1 DUF947-domain-containing protein [Xylona heveae TC161]